MTVAAVVGFVVVTGPAGASTAGQTVTYEATVTLPAPPSSNFAGASGGGDGWAVAVSATQVFNVFHHQQTLMVMCHNQSDASACWPTYRTVTDTTDTTANFTTPGQPGLYLDQTTGDLYVFATRLPDDTAGVVCIDTAKAATTANPFCGFTPLTSAGGAPDTTLSYSGISDPVVVGHDWYAFNYVSGTATGTEDTLLCFDLSTDSACASQPFSLAYGGGALSSYYPAPGITAMNGDVVVQVPRTAGDAVACFDTTTGAACAGTWPVSATGFAGDPVPLMNATGTVVGACTTYSTVQCWDTSGAPAAAPSGLSATIGGNYSWNGGAVVIGTRIYVPNGATTSVDCYDFAVSAACTNFPKHFTTLGLLYTVNADPYLPDCLWVNSDNGASQIQNFDAFTGGSCAKAPLRILASSVVATQYNACLPTYWTSLQVLEPPPGDYTGGTVTFETSKESPITGLSTQTLNATGDASLRSLNLPSNLATLQFVITLANLTGWSSTAQVRLTWSGTYSPDCVQGTTVVATATAPSQPAAPALSGGDGSVTVVWTSPSDGYSPITGYTVTAYGPSGAAAGTCTGSASASSCIVSGLTDGTAYTFKVTATNAIGSTMSPAAGPFTPMGPSVATTSLPMAAANQPYSTALAAVGGVQPYTWKVVTGSLPSGITLAVDGSVTGRSSAVGSYGVTVQVTDAKGRTATRSLNLMVGASAANSRLMASTPDGKGYWVATPAGGVFSFGDAHFYGSRFGKPLNAPVVGIQATPDGHGYWLAAADGGVFSFGDAHFYGSMGGKRLNAPVIGMDVTPDGRGYWLVAKDGGVFSFGDAHFYGSLPGLGIEVRDIVGMTSAPSGHGYWLVGADGGVFSFGDAHFYGCRHGKPLNAPVVGMASTSDGMGYWLVAADGGVFTYGDAHFYGSMGGKRLAKPVDGLNATPDGMGYWLVAQDGGVFTFGDGRFFGSLPSIGI